MSKSVRSMKKPDLNRILFVINIIVFVLTFYAATVKLYQWVIIIPAIDANLHRLLSLVFLSQVKVHVNLETFNVWAPRIILFGCLLILAIKSKYIRKAGFWLASLPLLSILVISALSRTWSVASNFSAARFLFLATVLVSAVYIGLEFKKSSIFWLFEAISAALVLGSIYIVIRQPFYGILPAPNAGVWKGLFWWKSYLGEMTAFAALMFLFRLTTFNKNRWFVNVYAGLFYLLSLFVLIKARAITEVLALIVVHFLVAAAFLFSKWGHLLKAQHYWLLAGAGLVVFALAWFGRGYWLVFFGKSASLTGRIPMWNELVPYIQQRIWLGYGFGEAFWKSPNYQPVISQAVGWNVPFAHNGFIEVLLGTGMIGLVLWIVFLAEVTVLSFRFFFRERSISSSIFLAWIAYTVISNLADNLLGSYEYFTVMLLGITFGSLIRDRLDQKQVQMATSRAQRPVKAVKEPAEQPTA